MDAQGTHKKGISDDFRLLIYRYVNNITKNIPTTIVGDILQTQLALLTDFEKQDMKIDNICHQMT